MSNLIINGIDHSAFDIEWAKRGGVIVINLFGKRAIQNWTQFGLIGFNGDGEVSAEPKKPSEFDENYVNLALEQHNGSIRMATPEECADAGVEYIEPPMIWRDIESAPKNQLILLLQHTLSYGDCIYSGAYVDGEWLDYTGKVHNSPHLWMPRP